MSRYRRDPLDWLLADLDAAGVAVPPGLDEDAMARLAPAASHFARHHKDVTIHDDGRRLEVRDARVTVEVLLDACPDPEGLVDGIEANAPHAGALAHRTLLWLEAGGGDAPEFAFEHQLYGGVTLYRFPTKPKPSKDPRIAAASEAGWRSVLKEHNLIPGRGLIVEDGHHGLFLTHPDASLFAAVAVHLASGEIAIYLNPFVEARWNDPEFRFWLQWGPGDDASGWKEVLFHAGEDEPADDDGA